VLYPQVHDILFYVDKRNPLGAMPVDPTQDSQFKNWEQGAVAWATSTIPNFIPGATYNRPIPPGAVLVETTNSAAGSIIVVSPTAGSFIKNNQLIISAQIQSQKEIVKIEAYFNDQLFDIRNGSLGVSPLYQASVATGASNPQNVLTIVATDITGTQLSKEVIVYRQ
jgi:glutathione S-transferase